MEVLAEIILELVLKGPGYLVLRCLGFDKKSAWESDEALVVAGLFFWAIVAGFACIVWVIFLRSR